jgi:hypothetical protein
MNLEVDFAKACNEEKGFLLFTREELAGVPEDVVAGFPEQDGKLKVTHKTPDYVPLMCVILSLPPSLPARPSNIPFLLSLDLS